MALIEHLERDHWREFLRDTFAYTLDVIKNDRFRHVGSAADDLRGWLTAGGIPRVKERLNRQMEMRRFSATRQAEINQFLEQLARENRGLLVELTTGGVLPSTLQDGLAAQGFSKSALVDLLNRILAGEQPFEDWMRAQGHSDQDIAETYQIVDRWLIERGLIPPPADSSLH
jgi:hypothetical protein